MMIVVVVVVVVVVEEEVVVCKIYWNVPLQRCKNICSA
jgi:hypothetical protein